MLPTALGRQNVQWAACAPAAAAYTNSQLAWCLLPARVGQFHLRKIMMPAYMLNDIMDYFLAGEDQQQTNQPNDLAGG